MASITDIDGDSTVNVATNNSTVTKSYTLGTVKDQYGVNWYQDASWDTSSMSNGVTFSNGTLSVPSSSNRADNYTVTLKEKCGSATNTKTVTINVFDYIVVFKDHDGSTLKTQTGINYNGTATPPTHPVRDPDATYHYDKDGWDGTYQNLTTGAQTKTVTAKYAGSVHTPYLTYQSLGANGHEQYCSYCGYVTIALEAHSFGSWTDNGDGTRTHECSKCQYSATENISYTVTLNANGGTNANGNTITYNKSSTTTLPTPTWSGWTFNGWLLSTSVGGWTAGTYAAGTSLNGKYGNVTLVAQWKKDVSATFYWASDASGTLTATIYNGDTGATWTTAPAGAPTDGTQITVNGKVYTFNGWAESASATSGSVTTFESGKTYYATYTAPVTLTYGGSGAGFPAADSKTSSYTYQLGGNTSVSFTVSSAVPTWAGYTFLGWADTANATAAQYQADDTITATADKTIYAVWSPTPYTITYDENGGTTVSDTQYDVTQPVTLAVAPARDGYEFGGWKLNADAGNWSAGTYTAGQSFTAGKYGDVTLVAQWTPVSYTITYDPANGSAATTVNYDVTTNLTLAAAPEKTGYSFAGWKLASAVGNWSAGVYQAGANIGTGKSGTITLTAQWEKVTYTITYDTAGGSVSPANPASYDIETASFTLNNPTRDGYTFAGWTGTGLSAATMSVTIAQGSTGDRTYTATWTPISYSISYDLDGGSVSPANPASYTIETASFTLTNPTKPGYTFAGWTGTGLSAAAMSVTIAQGSTGDRSYTATWTEDVYNITYTLGGGTNAAGNPATYKVTTETITLADPTRNGYTFDGWTGSNGDTPQKGVQIVKGSTGDKAYTANWTAIVYTISYELDGGSVSGTNPASYTIESGAITLVNPTKAGYAFAGWTGTDLTAAAQTVTIPTGSTGNRSYTATWTKDVYTITYNLGGGTVAGENPTSYSVDTPTFTLINPTRNGYTFTGWTGTGLTSAAMTVAVSVGSTGERTYTANWSAIEYPIHYVLNGGTNAAGNPSSYTVESADIVLADPTRAGYTFAGWTDSDTIPTGSTGEKTFTAHWRYTAIMGSAGTATTVFTNVQSISDSGTLGVFTLTNGTLTYKPNTMAFNAADEATVMMKDGTEVKVTVVPAAVLYYDDTETGNALFSYAGEWLTAGDQTETIFDTAGEIFGNVDTTSQTTYFGGAARLATVTAANALGNTGGKVNYSNTPNVTFTFTGTAFEVLSAVDSNAATVSYTVTDESGKSKNYIVDAYSGYTYESGQWTNSGNAETKYRVPLIRQELEYGTYTVQIGAFYNSYFARSHGSKPSYTFTFDGVRIYDPANSVKDTAQKNAVIYGAYSSVGQADWTEQTLKSAIKEIDSGAKLLVEGSSITGDQYAAVASACPNNELWLKEGTLTVKLSAGVTKAWLSVACVDGSAQIKVENKPYTVNYGTQYIDLNADGSAKMITVQNVGESGILSLRNIRFVAEPETSPVVTPARISLFMRASAADDTFHVLSPFTDEELNEHLEALANAPVEQPTEEPTQPVVEPTEEPTQPVEPTEPAVEPTQPNSDGVICAYCGKSHPKTFFGSLIRVIHMIIYFFQSIFGLAK